MQTSAWAKTGAAARAVVIVAGVVAIILVVAFVAMILVRWPSFDRAPNQRAQQGEAVGSSEPLIFGDADPVEGTPWFVLPVIEERGGGIGSGSYSGYRPTPGRNMLVVDSRTGAARRLLPDNRRALHRWNILRRDRGTHYGPLDLVDDPTPSAEPPIAYLAVVGERGDKAREQGVDLLIGSFETGEQRWLARDLIGFDQAWILPEGRIAMIVHSRSGTVYSVVDPQDFRIVLSREIAM